MITVKFDIYAEMGYPSTGINEKTILKMLKDRTSFKDELLQKNPSGRYGRVEIKFYKHSFTIETDSVWGQLYSVHLQAIAAILQNSTFRTFLQNAEGDNITFDYIDCDQDGVRIRHFGDVSYEDDKGNTVYRSRTDYMLQEIIVPKVPYMIEMTKCIKRFIKYRKLLGFSDENFKTQVNNIEKELSKLTK